MLVTGHKQQPPPERAEWRVLSTRRQVHDGMSWKVHEEGRTIDSDILSLFSAARDSIPETTTEKWNFYFLSSPSILLIFLYDFPSFFSFARSHSLAILLAHTNSTAHLLLLPPPPIHNRIIFPFINKIQIERFVLIISSVFHSQTHYLGSITAGTFVCPRNSAHCRDQHINHSLRRLAIDKRGENLLENPKKSEFFMFASPADRKREENERKENFFLIKFIHTTTAQHIFLHREHDRHTAAERESKWLALCTIRVTLTFFSQFSAAISLGKLARSLASNQLPIPQRSALASTTSLRLLIKRIDITRAATFRQSSDFVYF